MCVTEVRCLFGGYFFQCCGVVFFSVFALYLLCMFGLVMEGLLDLSGIGGVALGSLWGLGNMLEVDGD